MSRGLGFPAYFEEDWEPILLSSLMPRRPSSRRPGGAGPSASSGTALDIELDVLETKDRKLIVYAQVPGCKKEELDVSLHANTLTISGKCDMPAEYKEKATHLRTYERVFGKFSRDLTVPPGLKATEVKASLADGVLRVECPLVVAEPAAESIPVEMGGQL